MSKQALDAPRGTFFQLDPAEIIIIVDPKHPLYDVRVEKPLTEEFIKNLYAWGVKKPIDVRKNGKLDNGHDRVEVVDGRRRVRGAREANRRRVADGLEPFLVPVIIQKGTDSDMDALMVLGNSNREDDDFVTCAEKANRLIGLHGIEKTALLFGKSVQTVEGWLKLLDLDESVKAKVRSGEIAATAVYALADIPREEQKAVLVKLAEDGKTNGSGVKGAVEQRTKPARYAVKERLKASKLKLFDIAWSWAAGVGGDKAKLDDLKEAATEFAAAKEAAKKKVKKKAAAKAEPAKV